MSRIDLNEIGEDMTRAAEQTQKMYKKASRLSPRMKKEITVKTQYYSHKCGRHPCAESLLKLDINCNLLKLLLLLIAVMLVCSLFCMKRKKKKACKEG